MSLNCHSLKFCELCKHIARGNEKYGKNPRDLFMSTVRKYTFGTLSRVELGNFLDNFKTRKKMRLLHYIFSILNVGKNILYHNVLLILYIFMPYVHKIMIQKYLP